VENDFVTIRTFTSLWRADFARSMLEAEGIPARLLDDQTVVMQWLWANGIGGVKLRVRRGDVEAALEILERAEERRDRIRTADEPAEACPECGSGNTRMVQRGRRWFFISILLLGLPFFWPPRGRRCEDCGATWRTDHS
jgi:hypothetical protein